MIMSTQKNKKYALYKITENSKHYFKRIGEYEDIQSVFNALDAKHTKYEHNSNMGINIKYDEYSSNIDDNSEYYDWSYEDFFDHFEDIITKGYIDHHYYTSVRDAHYNIYCIREIDSALSESIEHVLQLDCDLVNRNLNELCKKFDSITTTIEQIETLGKNLSKDLSDLGWTKIRGNGFSIEHIANTIKKLRVSYIKSKERKQDKYE